MAYPYVLAQDAMAKLREAIYLLLNEAPASGTPRSAGRSAYIQGTSATKGIFPGPFLH